MRDLRYAKNDHLAGCLWRHFFSKEGVKKLQPQSFLNRKKILRHACFFFIVIAFFTKQVPAQSNVEIPPFLISLSSGQLFKAADLPKGKPVVLIYFSPDCDHCHTLMNELFKRIEEFRSATLVMITYKPVHEVVAFESAYNTHRHVNVIVGTEGSGNYLRQFYKLQNTPFTALYNKQGKLVRSYRKETPLNDLLKQLKAM